jgi:DNA-binding response OmpR family regulator
MSRALEAREDNCLEGLSINGQDIIATNISQLKNHYEILVNFPNRSFRYISIDDRSQDGRNQYLSNIIPSFDSFAFGDSSTYALSAEPHYDVLFIGGEDSVRIAKFIRLNAKLLAGRLTLILTARSSPSKRARLLNAGSDDVFDIDRMETTEAATRLLGHMARHEIYRQSFLNLQTQFAQIDEVVDAIKCSQREIDLVRLFIKANFISYAKIKIMMGDVFSPVSENNMKVIISNLRKKLKPNSSIIAKAGLGYALYTKKSPEIDH